MVTLLPYILFKPVRDLGKPPDPVLRLARLAPMLRLARLAPALR